MALATRLLVVSFVGFCAVGCGDDQDPEGAMELWDRIHAQNYRSFDRAPGYPSRSPTSAPHGDEVDIYVNDVVVEALATAGRTTWPKGSLIVKDGWSGGDLEIVAAMEKRDDGWFWVEWDGEGDAGYSGKPDICIDCHASGSDGVRAFSLP